MFTLSVNVLDVSANNTTVIQHPNGITETITRFPNTAIEEVVQATTSANPPVVADVQSQAKSVEQRFNELKAANPNIPEDDLWAAAEWSVNASAWDGPVKIITTEKIPWANCTCIADGASRTEDINGNTMNPWSGEAACGNANNRKYSCTVGKWLSGFQDIFREITRWVVYITMLLWVIAIASAGIMWAWGSDSEEYTKKAKWWVMNILIGLVILFTFRYILWFLAPWIFQ